jgi:single-strand DNA-binding protein
MNRIILIGNLTKDPELTTTQTGVSVCKFTLAVGRPFKNAANEQEADFFSIIVWRVQAENCGKYLKKGKKCAVEGRVENRSYEDKEGNRRYVTEIIADRVEFLGDNSSKSTASEEEFEEPAKKIPASKGKKKMAELKEIENDDDLPF